MPLRHTRFVAGLLAILGLLSWAPVTSAAVSASAARMKEVQRTLLLRGARMRIQEARELKKLRAKRGRATASAGVSAKRARRIGLDRERERERELARGMHAERPIDWKEADGPQGSHAPRTDAVRRATPARANVFPPANVRVNNTAGDGSAAGQSEPSVAAWGQYVVVGWNDGQGFDRPAGSQDTQGFGYSTDGGLTFTDGDVPRKNTGWEWTSDPVIAVNEKTGEFWFAAMVNPNGSTNGLAVVKGTFAGNTLTWGTPQLVRQVNNSIGFLDKPWITADSLTGNLYVTYTMFGVDGDTIDFHRSTNGGAAWSNPLKLSPNSESGLVQGSRPVVGPAGEVYVTWYLIGIPPPPSTDFRDHFHLRKSTDFGQSFAPVVNVADLYANFGTGAPGYNRENGITFPSIAVDRTHGPHSGRVYVTWNESVNFYDDDLGSVATVNETETNDTPPQANLVALGTTIKGFVTTDTDFDYFAFTGTAGQTVILFADSVATGLDMSFRLFCSDGTTRLAFSAPGPGNSNLIVFTLPATGTYYIRCASFGGTGRYSISTGTDGGGAQRARDHRDVFVTWSDGGGSFPNPVQRVSDSPAGFDDWLPEVAVSAQGRPYAIWYDFRDSPALNCGGVSNTYLSRSDDGGATWVSLGAISDVSTNWTNVLSNILPNQGDYLGFFANAVALYPVWADGRGGTPDVFTVTLPLTITPVQVSLGSAVATSDRVSLTWFAAGTGSFVARVWRREESGDWAVLADVSPDGQGLIRYDDLAVRAGARYVYRLGITESAGERFTSDVWVDVPANASFALSGARPNPTSGDGLHVSFSLSTAAPATLALYDVSGRLVRSREVGGTAGTQIVHLGEGGGIEPGVYLVRLTQSGRTLTSRVTVTR